MASGDNPSSMEVVICGGGIIGCSTAYYLSLRGVAPTIVERVGIACAASGKAGGFMAKDWCDHFQVGPLARASFDLHEELSKTFPNTDYRRLDTLSVSAKEGSASMKKSAATPWLDGCVTSMSSIGNTSTTAQVHPRKLCNALFEAAQTRGAKLKIGTVEGIEFTADKKHACGVKVDGDVIPADVVVITMGPWTGTATKWLPVPPVKGSRAHSVVLKPKQPVTPHALFVEYQPSKGRPRSPEVYPRPDGEVYVCGFGDGKPLPSDPSKVEVNEDSIKQLHEISGKLSSSLAEAEVTASQACYLPATGDGLPVIGKVPRVQGAYVASGHTCWGIMNGPGTGKAMSELIVDGKAKLVDLSAFDPARFF